MSPDTHAWLTWVFAAPLWGLAFVALALALRRRSPWLALAGLSLTVFPTQITGYASFFLLRALPPVALVLAVITRAEPGETP